MAKANVIQSEESTALDELIEQQHVSEVNELDEISRLWPANDDPDRLFEYILKERAERRQQQSQREPNG